MDPESEERQNGTNTPETGAETQSLRTTWERLAKVIASPSDAFRGLSHTAPFLPNWSLPLIIAIAVQLVVVFFLFFQADYVEKVLQHQEAALEAQVNAGQISESEAEELLDRIRGFMSRKILLVAAFLSSVLVPTISWLMMSALFHGIVRIGSSHFLSFSKCLETIGLCSIVQSLGQVVNLLLVLITGNLNMTLSLALAFQDFDPTIETHAMAAEINLLRLWYIWVLGVAWSRLTGFPVNSAVTWLLGSWVAFRAGMILLL